MVCMNGGAAMPSLKSQGEWLPGKAEASGHILSSKPTNSHVNLAVLLADSVSLPGTARTDWGMSRCPVGMGTGILAMDLEVAWCLMMSLGLSV